jgi:CHAD domain-containing protein
MADGKWITGLKPDMPLDQAARNVLAVRLGIVREWLPKVIQEADRDPEHVHQLRVATRRADAALRIFRCCLSSRAYRAARARLRTIRRAAGEARDWDVFLIDLRERIKGSPGKSLPGLDFLLGYATGQRAAAQASLETLESDWPDSFTDYLVATLGELREPHENDRATLIEHARCLLARQFGRLHEKATGDLSDYDHLHQVRIAGKRLRYALEVFAECFGPTLRERVYPLVEEMQEILGRANDSHVAAGRLTGLRTRLHGWEDVWERLRPGLEGLLRFHQRRLPQERKQFLKWWEGWSAAGAEAVLSERAVAAVAVD